MKDIFPYISPLIESQFPEFYKEEGENFIAFVKAYYEWLETENNVLWHSRRLLNTFDIDDTSEDFIVYFKEQILKNVQFTTASNKRLFIKNALDFYRSKGTPRSIDLFFKLVYGKPAKINYPADHIFRLSDNTWKIPTYLEISNSPYNKSYNGKQIRGLTSGSTAFVEGFTTRKINNNILDSSGNPIQVSKLINILYITNLSADFETNETIVHDGIDDPERAPRIIGSATSLSVLTGGANYKVGDIVELESASGILGKAVVRETEDASGQVRFELIKGGWGYTTSPNIIVAPKTVRIGDISTINRGGIYPYEIFEHLDQPLGNAHFISANSELFQTIEIGDTLKIYDDATYKSNIKLITSESISPFSNGDLYFSVISGDSADQLDTDIAADTDQSYQIRTSDDAVVANVSSFINLSAFANIIGFKDTSTVIINDIVDSLSPTVGETIEQKNTQRTWATADVVSCEKGGSTTTLTVNNFRGAFIDDISFSTNDFDFVSSANLSTANSDINFDQYEPGDQIIVTSSTDNDGTYTIRTIYSPQLLEIVEGWPGTTGVDSNYINITTNFRITGQSSGSNSHLSSYDYIVGLNETSDTSVVEVTFTSPLGSDYSNNDLVTFTPVNGGSGAAANVQTDVSGGITGITMIRNGIGYLVAPTAGINSENPSATGANGNLTSVLGNPFDYQYTDTFVVSESSNTSGYIEFIPTGSLASFTVASLDDEEENITVWTDIINGVNVYGQIYADEVSGTGFGIDIDSVEYGFPKLPTANLTNGTIESTLGQSTLTIGSIAAITTSNPGEDYNISPVVTVIEQDIYNFKLNDYQISTTSTTSGFLNGEKLDFKVRKVFNANTDIDDLNDLIVFGGHPFANGSQVTYTTDLGATALTGLSTGGTYEISIPTGNTTAVGLKTIPAGTTIPLAPTSEPGFNHYLTPTSTQLLAEIDEIVDNNTLSVIRKTLVSTDYPTANTIITGESSGYSTVIWNITPTDSITGLNASINASTVTANGVVTKLDVFNSGLGYQYFDVANFNRIGTNEDTGTAKIFLGKQGQSEGFFRNQKSFLSGPDAYLQDGDYYQEFSYEIESSIPFQTYFDMLKKVLHLAGTKMFASTSIGADVETTITSSKQFERTMGFNPSTDIITAPGDPTNYIVIDQHGFVTGNTVIYTYDQGNTAIDELVFNQEYLINIINSSAFHLNYANNIEIDFDNAPYPNEVGHFFTIVP